MQDEFITIHEVLQKRRSISIGQKINIPIKICDPSGSILGVKMRACPVVKKYKHFVVFRKPSGMNVSHTYIELCLLDRGREI